MYTACESRRYWMRTLGCAVVMICSLLKPHLYRNPSRPTRKKRRTEAEMLSEMLEIPQASVFNGKPAQEKAPATVQRRRKAYAVQSILAAHRDSLRAARMG